jgi:protein-disulfide isomerase
MSGISRRWLYGGIGAVVVAIVLALVLASQLGGGDSAPPTAIDPGDTNAMLDGIPQSGTSLGSPDAPVVLYEFADLQCPYCQKWDQNVLPVLIQDYVRDGKLRIVFRGLTFIGPDSEKALRSALAAGEQDRLWNVVDLFYHHQGPENSGWVTDDLIEGIGSAVPGLDVDKMTSDQGSGSVTEEIASAASQADQNGLHTTPSFLIGTDESNLTVLHFDRLEPDQFRQAIDAALGQ